MTFSNIKKSILMNLKIPGTVFCLFPFQILKKHTDESENTWQSFLHIHFWNIKKSIVIISKNLGTVFLFIPFSNIKESILTNPNIPGTDFCLSTFQLLKKVYLWIWKYLAKFFCLSPFQILKKPTYKSRNTWHSFIAYPVFKY